MHKLNVRQICFWLAAVLPVSRLIVYPATLSFRAGNDLLWPALWNLIAEGTVLDAGGGSLRIRCMGLELDKAFLYLPAGLDCAWTEDDGAPELLRPGDKLLCWTADKQTFYIICKAVTV